jgi:hypothetical protein
LGYVFFLAIVFLLLVVLWKNAQKNEMKIGTNGRLMSTR